MKIRKIYQEKFCKTNDIWQNYVRKWTWQLYLRNERTIENNICSNIIEQLTEGPKLAHKLKHMWKTWVFLHDVEPKRRFNEYLKVLSVISNISKKS